MVQKRIRTCEQTTNVEAAQKMQSPQVSVTPNAVPAFIHTSDLYRALDEDSNGPIQVPANCIKADDTVNTLGDLALLFRTMIYWIIPVIPRRVIESCYLNDFSTWREVFEENLPDDVLVKDDMRFIFDDTDGNADRRIVRAMKKGRDDVVEYFVSISEFSDDADTVATAASLGRLDYLTLLRESGYFWSERTCEEAAAHGHLACLTYARNYGCPWPENLSNIAAEHGQLECLQYIHEHGGAWNEETCMAAAAHGHDHCLEFLNYNSCPWDERVTLEAARGGHARCLEYAIVYSCPVHPDAAGAAAGEGHLDCLRLMWVYGEQQQDTIREYPQFSEEELRQKIQQTRFPRELVLNESVTSQAVIHDRMDVLFEALHLDCPCADDLVKRAAQVGNVMCLKHLVGNLAMYMNEDVFMGALLGAHLPCVKYLVEQGCPFLGARQNDNGVTFPLPPDFDRRLSDCVKFAVEELGWRGEIFY